jgi:hypothetical protein
VGVEGLLTVVAAVAEEVVLALQSETKKREPCLNNAGKTNSGRRKKERARSCAIGQLELPALAGHSK